MGESHISAASSNTKDIFCYLMEDIDESTSEQNIPINSISDYSQSVPKVTTKAGGEYTLRAEFFFPDGVKNINVDASSAVLNVGQLHTKVFSSHLPKYARTIIQLHKYQVTLPEYIYLRLYCNGSPSSPAQA